MMIPITTVNVIDLVIYGSKFSWLSNTVNWSSKWLVDFIVGNGLRYFHQVLK